MRDMRWLPEKEREATELQKSPSIRADIEMEKLPTRGLDECLVIRVEGQTKQNREL